MHRQSLRDICWITKEEQCVSVNAGDSKFAGDLELPSHFDGGRAFLVWAVSLWSARLLRIFDANGEQHEVRCNSGHTNFAGFLGPKHHVVRPPHAGPNVL